MKKYFLNKMSTGKRLAKRSIIGMRVCALGDDGLYYPGRIHAVKTPSSPKDNQNCINLTPNTRYSVRFDPNPAFGNQRRGINEFSCSELIGDGFASISDVKLKPGQKVYITHNGRETFGTVTEHDVKLDEVEIEIAAAGNEAPMELTKKLEEVRLSESRRSPRLADQDRDTDFARLADMAGDRRRTSSQCIEVPLQFTQNGSRKRRTSDIQDERYFMFNDEGNMDECNAALVLMSLSASPNSNSQLQAWDRPIYNDGASCSGSSSPPLSDDGNVSSSSSSNLEQHRDFSYKSHQKFQLDQLDSNNVDDYIKRGPRTTSLSASDEGIVMDYSEEMARKKKSKAFKCTFKLCGSTFATDEMVKFHIRSAHLGPQSVDDEEFYFTDLEDDDDEAIFMEPTNVAPPSPPTLSHRDMARPPHEDPEYQRKLIGNMRQGILTAQQTVFKTSLPMSAECTLLPTNSSYSWSPLTPTSLHKHMRLSQRQVTSSYSPYPSPSYIPAYPVVIQNYSVPSMHIHMNGLDSLSHSSPPQLPPPPQQHQNNVQRVVNQAPPPPPAAATVAANRANRRTRGENKKCRKVYGMENRDAWCTQCKWKKACSRFGD